MKKRLTALILTTSMIFGLSGGTVFGSDKKGDSASRGIIDRWKADTGSREGFGIKWDRNSNNPDFIKGRLASGVLSEGDVTAFLQMNKGIFNMEDGDFRVESSSVDKLGMKHYRVKQVVGGIPVYGGDLIVHTDAGGNVYAVNGEVKSNIKGKRWGDAIRISNTDAIGFAEGAVEEKANEYLKKPSSELFLYEYNKRVYPVYVVELDYIDPVWAKWKIFVNAENGAIVDKFNSATFAEEPAVGTGLTGFNETVTINTVKNNGVYYLIDTTKPMSGKIKTYDMNYDRYYNAPGTLVSDSDNNFNSQAQKAAVSAHYYIGKVYDYYKSEYNRNSYDNNGADIVSNVHCAGRNGERNWNNAAWIGDQFVYGDGDGTTFSNLSDAFDVVAHEFTHGVTDTSSDLEYRFQSGAINEAISDIIGVAVENEAGDWLVGEDCYTPGTSGDALRSMQDPTLYNQPAHMDDYRNHPIDYDNGGVHINSGIINKAAYNIGSVVGMYKMGQIFYRANTVYYTSTSDFDDARSGAVQAAEDLYGANSSEKTAVMNGFAAVGIGSEPPTGDGPFEPNDSFDTAHGSLVSGNNYDAYIETASDDDYYYIDVTGSGDIEISLSNLAGDYDLYLYNSSKSQVAKSTKSSTSNESISYSASGAGKYYVKVIGYNGVYSTSKAYRLNVTYPSTAAEYTWHYVDKVIESDHDYANNENSTETYSKPGAAKVAVHFVKIDTETGYDFVYVKDKDGNTIKTYDGSHTDFWAVIEGDKLFVNLKSDYSITKYGYKIDRVAYYDNSASVSLDTAIKDLFKEITNESVEVESTFDPENIPEKK